MHVGPRVIMKSGLLTAKHTDYKQITNAVGVVKHGGDGVMFMYECKVVHVGFLRAETTLFTHFIQTLLIRVILCRHLKLD